ncbi:MAG: HD domain-containing protein [Humibacillus sp.]|nr:HD domain-containing protein [Humibacillus sp.]MDN5779733.1 HD domain-containing protein [Humibacillus sp.]
MGEPVRLAEIIGALSLGVDLGFGQPMEHVLRQCRISLRLADLLDVGDEECSVVYYTALLTNVGCHTDAHEQAKWFGHDIGLKSDKYTYGVRGVRSAVAGFRRIGSGQPLLMRFRLGVNFALAGHREIDDMIRRHSSMARRLANEIGLPQAVQDAVAASYEQWDGRGYPGELSGNSIPLAARVSQLAEFVEVAHRSGGVVAATGLARKLAGNQFDPDLAEAFAHAAGELLADMDDADTWGAVIADDPVLDRPLTEEEFDTALGAVADFVDLKSPYMLGHARAVARLVDAAGAQLGLVDERRTTLRRAALAHGLGRLGVSNAIWDKPGPLGAAERERVHLQPYFTDRMLRQSPALAPIGVIAGQLRERLDGSGYPHGLAGDAIGIEARILGAADVYQARGLGGRRPGARGGRRYRAQPPLLRRRR